MAASENYHQGHMQRFWQTILQSIVAPARVDVGQLPGLLAPFGRPAAVRRHAASVIVARVQLIAALFALLVPFWSVVDFWAFDLPTASALAMLRCASAGVFVALAWPREISPARPYTHALTLLVALLMVPPLFYLISLHIIDFPPLDPGQRLVANLYTYMPTVVLGGLAIFPLTALEIFVLALPVIGAGLLGMGMNGAALSLQTNGAELWFMAMMIGVAMFSGMSQAHYMATLVQKVTTDPLTGCYTRRSGSEGLDLLYRLASMSGKPLSIAFLDLDHFKQINDNHGHDAGDQALRTMTDRLRTCLRRSDLLIRWGGEEFVVVMPDMPAASLPVFLDRVATQGLGTRPDGRAQTASIGIAESQLDPTTDWPRLVELADQRMYEAKRSGRNAVVLPGGKYRPVLPGVEAA